MGATTFLSVKNRATSLLAGTIAGGDLSLAVTGGDGVKFPTTYPFHITIHNEILVCTNVTTDTLTVTRGAEGTTGASHTAGATVSLNITSQIISDLDTAVNKHESGSNLTIVPTAKGGVPYVGTTGQVLKKNSNTNYDTTWGTASGGSTVLHALVPIQVVAADTVSVTTCTSNANFYEPAAQSHLTSNSTYKRYVSAKVSLQSNTAGVVTVSLWDVTTAASLATATVTITTNVNTEVALAATTVTQQVTNLSDVLTIKVKHAVNGATVTLNSGGIMEADSISDISTTGYKLISAHPVGGMAYISSWEWYCLQGLSTASITNQLANDIQDSGLTLYSLIASSSSTTNSLVNPTLATKAYWNVVWDFVYNVSAISGQILIGSAFGLSQDNQ